jgi:hypothetical protein
MPSKETPMKKFAGFMIVFTLFAGLLIAQQAPKTITGMWEVAIVGESSTGHHFPSVKMELAQDGKKVTGNFIIPDHGDLPIEGVFADGKLTMHATEDGYMKMDLIGTVQADGSISGNVKGPMGDMKWTAQRAKSE